MNYNVKNISATIRFLFLHDLVIVTDLMNTRIYPPHLRTVVQDHSYTNSTTNAPIHNDSIII